MSTNPPRKARTILITFLIGFAAGAVATLGFLERYRYLIERPAEVMPAQSLHLQQAAWSQDRIDQMRPKTQQPFVASITVDPVIQTPLQVSQPEGFSNDAHGAVRPMIPELIALIAEDVIELRQRNMLLPLSNFKQENLRDSFDESRGNRMHEAIDILAPRNTAILAVEDGSIARLWNSVRGGITIYQFDPQQKYEYYYAHLESYAQGLKEGDQVKRGQVIGYVGTSGNAPRNTPHLHFTIFRLSDQKHWWEGTAVNPYLVYKRS